MVYIGFFVLLLFVAGEEISWGQRIFDIETLDLFQEINVQNENNIHNAFGYLFDHAAIAFVFTVGVLIPFLSRSNIVVEGLAKLVGMPLPTTGLALGFLIVSCIHEYTVYTIIQPLAGLRIAELREFLTSVAFLLLFIENWK